MVNPTNITLPPLGAGQALEPVLMASPGSGGAFRPLAFPIALDPGETVLLDWGRKRTGWVTVAGRGSVDFAYGSDLKFFEIFDGEWGRKPDFHGDSVPTFFATKARGNLDLGEQPQRIHERSAALRFLRLRNCGNSPATISAASLKPSEFPAAPAGSFECSDETLTLGWRMGIDTVHLCTQPGDESNVPVFGPFGDGYVQWDGCRRDREIWGGDLRTGSLAWYYNWQDQSPIANSLYLLIGAQHVGCDEHGVFPGSGSTHQKFYEWAFWEVTNLWEYILHTGDPKLTRLASRTVPLFLDWCEKKYASRPNRWIHTNLSWMYSFTRKGFLPETDLPSLQVVAIIGLQAMERLFHYVGQPKNAERAAALRQDITGRFHDAFWSEELKAYLFFPDKEGEPHRSDLCTNAWAILADMVPPARKQAILDSLRNRHWTDVGSLNVAPPYDPVFAHNKTVWPYSSAYEVLARLHGGDSAGAFEVMRRYVNACAATGHRTLFEMIYLDGSLPVQTEGNDVLSFCHAWSASGSWALQKYVLGIEPLSPGWKQMAVKPVAAPLEWAKGTVVTPVGLVQAEYEYKNGFPKGKVVCPKEIAMEMVAEGVEVIGK